MIVYKITNLINNKAYIGSTNNFDRRMDEHIKASQQKSKQSYNYPLQKALRKYGVENFSFEIIENDILEQDIAQKEKMYIQQFNTLVNIGHGYNQTTCTDCALRDPSVHQKILQQVSVPVAWVDEQENIIQLFDSLHAAARFEGSNNISTTIKQICEGVHHAIHGHIYRYYKDGKVIVPEQQLSRKRYKSICGISIYNKDDIVFYNSVSEASRQENVARSSLSHCIAGSHRYTHVNERI